MTKLSLSYFSFLWPNMVQMKTWQAKERPSNSFITDLAIRQIIENLRLDQKSKWTVEELLYKPCVSSDVIKYRLDIMEDLINSDQLFQLFKDVILLIDKFQSSETFEAKRLNSTHQAARFFQKAMLYTDVIITLQNGLNQYKEEINSKGLELLLDLISQIANLDTFIKMQQEIMRLKNQAKDIQPINIYFNCKNEKMANLLIDNSPVETGESLTARLIKASQQISFLVSHEEVDVNQGSNFSSLEERLLEETLRAYPDYFKDLDKLKNMYQKYPMEHLLPYSSELRFYTAMITMIKRLELHGFKFCKPQVTPEGDQRIQLNQVYDLSLALRLAKENQAVSSIVSNNHVSDETGRVFILTGPNQGGKTTFLRSIGIAQVLFQAGCFVPAERAVISPVDSIFTHFQEKEVLGVKKGRLGEEANRIAKIFHKATENSLILLNETFSSARRVDGYHLSKDVLKAMMKYRCQGIFVTHITELTQDVALLNEDVSDGSKLVNLVAGVVDLDDTGTQGERTYEIRRSIASTGLGYSRDITLKYGLTLEQLLSLFENRRLIKEEASYEP